ncbi:MAG: DNA endonuclease SmrA [Halioglobus sp.]|nr:DNA endonuclease SmrA [Halioglobus sp.]
MSGNDDRVFREQMAGVKPLKREPRVSRRRDTPGHDRSRSDPSIQRRREAALGREDVERNTLSDNGIEPLDPWYVLSFKRPGVQHGVFRKLKQGRYEPQGQLDLHRMTVERARHEIFEFVRDCYAMGLRSVLVIHGKGVTDQQRERSSILKGCADRWLRDLDPVQAFHSAQPRHGGTGALYVMLRKSEEQKRRTRDRFSKGRLPPDSD